MKKVAIITARSGSKGLVDKNMLMVHGKPLLAYSIETALNSGVFDEIILTTDSDEYIEMLSAYPIVMHRRPEHLATDTASTYSAIEEVILSRNLVERFDYFVQFQPTTPIRLEEHVVDLCRQFEAKSDDFDFAASVAESSKPLVLIHALDSNGGMSEWDIDYSTYRRQNYPAVYAPNGVYYIAKIKEYLEQKHFYGARSMAYIMDKKYSLDIDDRDDFEYFYFRVAQQKREELLNKQVELEVSRLQPVLSQEAECTLIGDSLFSQWSDYSGLGYSVQNLSVTAVSTEEYPRLVLEQCTRLASKVVVGIGRDDLRKQRCSPSDLVEHTLALLRAISRVNPQTEIFLLELPKTHFRVDCDNRLWDEFNPLMREAVSILSGVRYVELNSALCNEYGKLSMTYTIDGYNLNEAGYRVVIQTLNEHGEA